MSHIKVILIALAGVLLAIASGARADSLQLKNGNFVQGKYLGGTERAVRFVVEGKIHLYDIDEILSISFASASADGGIPSNAADRQSRPSFAPKSLARESSLIAFDSQAASSKRMEPTAAMHAQQTVWEQKRYRSSSAPVMSVLPRSNLCGGTKTGQMMPSSGASAAAVPLMISTSAVLAD